MIYYNGRTVPSSLQNALESTVLSFQNIMKLIEFNYSNFIDEEIGAKESLWLVQGHTVESELGPPDSTLFFCSFTHLFIRGLLETS